MTDYTTHKEKVLDVKSATYKKPNEDSISVDKLKIYTDDSPSGYVTIKPRKQVTNQTTQVIDGEKYPSETTDQEMYDLDDIPDFYRELEKKINNKDVLLEATVLEIVNEGSQNYMVIQPDNNDSIRLLAKDDNAETVDDSGVQSDESSNGVILDGE